MVGQVLNLLFQNKEVSMSGDYYTVKDSLPYKHHVETYKNETVNRNTFYGRVCIFFCKRFIKRYA